MGGKHAHVWHFSWGSLGKICGMTHMTHMTVAAPEIAFDKYGINDAVVQIVSRTFLITKLEATSPRTIRHPPSRTSNASNPKGKRMGMGQPF